MEEADGSELGVRRRAWAGTPKDPLGLASVSVVLFVVAVLAAYMPARRGTRVDPMVALGAE